MLPPPLHDNGWGNNTTQHTQNITSQHSTMNRVELLENRWTNYMEVAWMEAIIEDGWMECSMNDMCGSGGYVSVLGGWWWYVAVWRWGTRGLREWVDGGVGIAWWIGEGRVWMSDVTVDWWFGECQDGWKRIAKQYLKSWGEKESGGEVGRHCWVHELGRLDSIEWLEIHTHVTFQWFNSNAL